MYFNMVIFLMLFSTGKAIRCYECSETTEEECVSKQKSSECGQTEICMTLQYREKTTTSVVPSYQKTCSKNYKDCQNFCRSGPPDIVKDCKVLQCCNKDNCNHKIEKEKSNSKRSTYNSHSPSINNHQPFILLVILSLLTTYGYRIL